MLTARVYAAIDLKSYYSSIECADRHLDPLTTNLVVADASRTEKTICLAVSPALKAYGIPGRARLFEVVQRVREVNNARLHEAIRLGKAIRVSEDGPIPNHQPEIADCSSGHGGPRPAYAFASASFDANALAADPSLELSYIIAPPRMALYMDYSARIYGIYLRYIAPEDIHVYSIDECFLDLTRYLDLYHMTARELTMTLIREILYETGITATGGIGTNLYLAKIAMDIEAKHVPADKDGVRIAELDERSYREKLWAHTPLTDFWRVGPGIARKLEQHQIFTMGDIARCSAADPQHPFSEQLLYRLFGKNAELLIDHAWGWEPCTIEEIKAYKPATNSITSGQVLHAPYPCEKGRLIVREMVELLALDLVDKGKVTDQIALYIGYDIESLSGQNQYRGEIVRDHYGRAVPKPAHGSINLGRFSSSTRLIADKTLELYDQLVDPSLLIRRFNIAANHLCREAEVVQTTEQLDLFAALDAPADEPHVEETARRQELQLQKAMLDIKKRFGKNAILKGMNLEEGGTTIERNAQVGGHKA